MTAKAPEKRRTVLRDLIDSRGLRHSFIAERLGLPRSSMSHLLDGNQELRARHLVALEELLGVEAAVFFDGERLRFVDEVPLAGPVEGPDGD